MTVIQDSQSPSSAHHSPVVGYLVSQYPAVSHTFILREARALRDRGFDLHTASINVPDRPMAGLTQWEREEAERTFYVKRAGYRRALTCAVRALLTSPLQVVKTIVFAVRLSDGHLRSILWNLFYFIEALLLDDWTRRSGIRHLHVHFATAASTVALILHRYSGLPFSLTIHGPDEFDNVERYLLKEKAAAAAFLTCIGSYARSQILKQAAPADWKKVHVAPLGIDPEVFEPRPTPPSGEFVLLCVGRLVPAKGQHILVEAIGRLIAEGRRVRLVLVGDGPDRASLEEMVARTGLDGSVEFAGAVSQDGIRSYYEEAHAFVLASFAEGIPVVLMEAMAMQIPCVTTRITGIPELIRDGEDGLLVPASDVEALAAAIARLQDDAELCRELGVRARERVLSKYHLPTNINRLAAIYEQRLGACVA